jgi:Pentapeptide repeats (8 copies)
MDIGSMDIGSMDIGSMDIGSMDIGSMDIGSMDIGSMDIGSMDIGSMDVEFLTRNTITVGVRNTPNINEAEDGLLAGRATKLSYIRSNYLVGYFMVEGRVRFIQ